MHIHRLLYTLLPPVSSCAREKRTTIKARYAAYACGAVQSRDRIIQRNPPLYCQSCTRTMPCMYVHMYCMHLQCIYACMHAYIFVSSYHIRSLSILSPRVLNLQNIVSCVCELRYSFTSSTTRLCRDYTQCST